MLVIRAHSFQHPPAAAALSRFAAPSGDRYHLREGARPAPPRTGTAAPPAGRRRPTTLAPSRVPLCRPQGAGTASAARPSLGSRPQRVSSAVPRTEKRAIHGGLVTGLQSQDAQCDESSTELF